MSRKSREESAAALAAADLPAIPAKAGTQPRTKKLPPAAPPEEAIPAVAMPAIGETLYREIPLRNVFPPEAPEIGRLNPRKTRSDDGLDALKASILSKGVLQPILVRPARYLAPLDSWGAPVYETVAGDRRWQACVELQEEGKLAADYCIPARIRDCDDDELVILAAVENFDREDMMPLDEAELFATIRPRVTPEDGETREAAIARLFHIGERTVFRRLALLRTVPEVRQALAEGKITLAHAQAYSLGAPEKQCEVLEDHLGHGENAMGGPMQAADIKYEFTEGAKENEELIPLDDAIFDPELYQGRIVDDPETGERYFADPGEFKRLQELGLRAKQAELAQTWKWVDIDRRGWLHGWETHGVRKDDPDAAAVIRVKSEGGIQIVAPALRDATLVARRHASFQAQHPGVPQGDGGGGEAPAEKKPQTRPPLSEAQVTRLHGVKTQALRRALIARRTHEGRVPLALAVLGLLGAREIRDMGEAGYQGYGNRVHPVDSLLIEKTAIDHLLKTAALHLPADLKRGRNQGHGGHFDPADSEAAAAWFGALMTLSAEDLAELHTRLVAERVGSWLSADRPGYDTRNALPRLGDSPLAVAIAQYTGAEEELADLWQVDKEWFAQYGRDRLFAMALHQCHVKNANKLKKAELVDVVIADEKKGFWTAALFPEARFQSEADAAKALAGPLPISEPTREAAE